MAPAAKNGKATGGKRSRKKDDTDKPVEPPQKKKRGAKQTGKVNDAITIEDDETSPKTAGIIKKQEFVLKSIPRPCDDNSFLKFSDGDVVVQLESNGRKTSYILHSGILGRASPWFEQSLRLNLQQVERDALATAAESRPFLEQLKARYELDVRAGPNKNQLFRTMFTYPIGLEPPTAPSEAAEPTQSAIEIEDEPVIGTNSSETNMRLTDVNDVNVEVYTLRKPSADAGNQLPNRQPTSYSRKKPVNKSSLEPSAEDSQDTTILEKHTEEIDVVATDVTLIPVVESTQEMMQGDLHQNQEGLLSIKQYKLPPSLLIQDAEGALIFTQEGSDCDRGMDQSDTLIKAEPMEGVEVTNSRIMSEAASGAIFSMNNAANAVDEQSTTSIPSQNDKSQAADKYRDCSLGQIGIIGEDHKMDHEKAGEMAVAIDDSDYNNIAATERLSQETKGHTIVTADQIFNGGNILSNDVSSSSIEACGATLEGPPNLAAALRRDITAGKPKDSLLLGSSESGHREFETKKEEPDSCVSTQRLNAAGKDKPPGSRSGPNTAEETAKENQHFIESVHPDQINQSNNPTITHEKSENLTCAQVVQDDLKHVDQRLTTCTTLGGGKTEGNTSKFDDNQELFNDSQVQDHRTGNPDASQIPQLDGPSDEHMPETQGQSSTASIGKYCPSLDGIQKIMSSPADPRKSATTYNSPLLVDEGKLDIRKRISSSSRNNDKIMSAQDTSKPLVSREQASLSSSGLNAATKQATKVRTAPATIANIDEADVFRSYDRLFHTFYNLAPYIDTQNIKYALAQSEALVDLARLYGSIPVVRPYINSALMQFGQELYMAVMQDPPRWLQLAVYLESAPIFKEAIIHIVGNYRDWSWPTLKFEELFHPTAELIEKKLEEFLNLKESANKKLLSNEVRDVEVFSRALNKDDFDTWFVVQYWRDWFTWSLSKANKVSDSGKKCVRGKVYRDLRRGGEAYLPTILVLDAVEACRSKDLHSKAKRKGVERDLKTLKDFAQKAVAPLCVNHSMLSVEDVGIDYLTCIKVEDDELPWLK